MASSNKKRNKPKLAAMFRSSFFIYYLTKFSEFIYNAVSVSVFGHLMTSYDKLSKAFASSLIVTKVKALQGNRGGAAVKKAKHTVAKSYENSYLLTRLRRLSKALLLTHVNTLGLFLFSFGFYIITIQLLKRYTFHVEDLNPYSLVSGIAIMGLSILMFFSKKNIAGAIYESKILRFLLFDFLGLRIIDVAKASEIEARRGFNIPFILGMIFGVLSIFIEPIYLVLTLGLLLLASLIISSPEAGILLVFLTLPFLATMELAAVLILILLSYILKLICGRRVIKFTLVDFAVMIFLVFLFSGGVFSTSSSSVPKMLVFICFMLGYFVVKNTVRSPALVRKCLYSLAVSSVLVSFYGLYQNFFETPSTVWQDTSVFSEIRGRVVSTFANPNVLGEYLILVFPIILALMATAKHTNERFAMLLAAGANCACLVFTWSRGAWLGFAVSLILFCCLSSKHFFTAGILAIPVVVALLFAFSGTSIVRRFTTLGDSSTSYRLGIWQGVLLMLAHTFYFGIGIGEGAFADIYPFYALSGIETAPHSHNLYLQIITEIGVFGFLAFCFFIFLFAQCSLTFCKNAVSKVNKTVCLGIFCGITAFLIQGLTDYVWYNYRLFLLFWMLAGLGIAHIFTAKSTVEESSQFYY